MRAVQITFEEGLLSRLDEDEDVKRLGRSAVVRNLVDEFLRRKREARIDESYRRGYADSGGLGPEFEGWEEEGQWPEE